MIKALITLAAKIAGYFFSEEYREKKMQEERDMIAKEAAEGDEDAVNARIGRFRGLWPWIAAGVLAAAGCRAIPETVYVREADRVRALRPGAAYTNASDAVEWIVPRTVMTKLLISREGL